MAPMAGAAPGRLLHDVPGGHATEPAVGEDELLLGEQLLTEESVLYDQLIREMSAIGAGSVNTTWKYATGSRSASRAASHSVAAAP